MAEKKKLLQRQQRASKKTRQKKRHSCSGKDAEKEPEKVFSVRTMHIISGRAYIMTFIKSWEHILLSRTGKKGYFFAVWAPHAKYVSVTGEFNNWDTEADHMKLDNEVGVWTKFIPGVKEYQMYKFFIISPSGEGLYKSDPYANYAEERPGTASRTF